MDKPGYSSFIWVRRYTANWWLRSPNTNDSNNVCNVNTDGTANNNNYNNTNAVRPAKMNYVISNLQDENGIFITS